MSEAIELAEPSLETRTIVAHRTYILSLLACEKATHEVNCSICDGVTANSRDDRLIRAMTAAADKEACRIAFRDLLDELGYLPQGLTISLPRREDWSCPIAAHAH